MKKTMMNLLVELLKDSKRSDRELAKVLRTSQTTITRMRNKLVKDGLIQQFTVIPDITKMGFEILAVSSFKAKNTPDIERRALEWTMSKPNVIFAARAEGAGKNAVLVSIHKNYTDYSEFFAEITREAAKAGSDAVIDYETLLISLKGLIVKPFSLKYLAKLVETSED